MEWNDPRYSGNDQAFSSVLTIPGRFGLDEEMGLGISWTEDTEYRRERGVKPYEPRGKMADDGMAHRTSDR